MAPDPRPLSWWQTVPGILTGLAAFMTAATGLILALNQIGFFDSSSSPDGTASVAAPVGEPAVGEGGYAAAPGNASPIEALTPAMSEVVLGNGVYTLQEVRVTRRTPNDDGLLLKVRLMNNSRYDANFWDASFRLFVDGVPRAPVGGLNLLAPGNSATDGEVAFVIPRGARQLVLRIEHYGESADIPLERSPS